VRTLGIDLASQDERTAMAEIVWEGGRARVNPPATVVSDAYALDAIGRADWAGIDAPFGWPEAVVEALPAFADRGVWPPATTERLRFRLTDRFVRERAGAWPLSVSSDRIAVPAWRCARLLAAQAPGRVDRLGGNGVVEVYPGAALTLWGFDRRGYKRSGNLARQARQRDARTLLVDEVARRGAPWLDLTLAYDACVDSDDALDAVLAALVARAAALDLTCPPPRDELEVVRREGWIQLPVSGSFDRLADGER
jgi:hypothetical protein